MRGRVLTGLAALAIHFLHAIREARMVRGEAK